MMILQTKKEKKAGKPESKIRENCRKVPFLRHLLVSSPPKATEPGKSRKLGWLLMPPACSADRPNVMTSSIIATPSLTLWGMPLTMTFIIFWLMTTLARLSS